MKKIILSILIVLFVTVCVGQNATMDKANALLKTATIHTTLSSIEKHFAESGVLNLSDTSREGNINYYYDWELGKGEKSFSAWFVAHQKMTLIMKFKPLYDFSKCCPLSVAQFDRIERGMSYGDVVKILGAEGDLFRIDFVDTAHKTEYYNWYSCQDPDTYFNIWFHNGKVTLKLK